MPLRSNQGQGQEGSPVQAPSRCGFPGWQPQVDMKARPMKARSATTSKITQIVFPVGIGCPMERVFT